MARKSALLLAAAALTFGGLSACGGDKPSATASSDPKVRLAASIEKLQSSDTFSVAIRVTDANGTLERSVAKGTQPDTLALFKRLINGSLKITTAGKQDDPRKRSFKLELLEGSKADFVVTVIGGDLYVHLDKDFLKSVGRNDTLQGLARFSPELAAGGTVKLSGLFDQLSSLRQLSKGTKSPVATPSLDPTALSRAFGEALAGAVTVTSQQGSTYQVAVELKTLTNALAGMVNPILKGVGGSADSAIDKLNGLTTTMPPGAISGQVILNGDVIKELSVDLQSVVDYVAKADPSLAKDLPNVKGARLVLSFDAAAKAIAAPSGATPLNLTRLFSGLLGGFNPAGVDAR